MNDKLIISTISKIYFAITSFLLFVALILSIIFITLQNGLFIENITTKRVDINKLYIKWNEKLDISIKEIKIASIKSDTKNQDLLKNFSKQLSEFSNYYNIFEKILIDKIYYKDIESSFKYIRGGKGHIKVSAQDYKVTTSLLVEDTILKINVESFKDTKRDINLNGNIFFDTKNLSITSNLDFDIHREINGNIIAFVNSKEFFYRVKTKEIQSIKYLMKLLNLHPEVNYWANEAITFSKINMKSAYGWGSFDDLDNAYKNVYVHAVGDQLKYVYNQKLDAIHTKQTDVIFKNGILFIYPKEAYSYNSQLGNSWLKIDFTKKEELLSLKLLYDGILDKHTLEILKAYKIDVPFIQNNGVTNVDLALDVNLRTIDVNAVGKFFCKKGNFNYLDFELDVSDAYIKLNNYDVLINKMGVTYKDLATSVVDANYNAKTKQGLILVDLKSIDFKDLNLSLEHTQNPLKVSYLLSPKQDILKVAPSNWLLKNKQVKVEELTLPFNLQKRLLDLPKRDIEIEDIGKFSLAGFVDFNNSVYDFNASIEELYTKGLSLSNNKPIYFKVIYDKKLSIQTKEKTTFNLNSMTSNINPFEIIYKDGILESSQTYITIGDILKTKVSVEYSTLKNKGEVKTNRLQVQTKALGSLYFEPYDTNFILEKRNDSLRLFSSDLDMFFTLKDNSWNLDLHSVQRLSRNSQLLQKYEVTAGNASFVKNISDENIYVNSTLISSNKIMVIDNVPSDTYKIQGKVDTMQDLLDLNINDKVNVQINKNISLKVKDTGINLDAIVNIVNAKGEDINNYGNDIVNLEAVNTFLFISPTRHVLTDSITMHYANKILTASLQHKKGIAHLKFKNGQFHTKGEKFNDEFMQNLFSLSKFKDGDLQFVMSGTPKNFDGLITINKTTLLDYKLLNNVLAFVNTVPSLVTFSLPNYSTSGLKIENAYMKFNSKENIFHISDLFINSKELDIFGIGEASFVQNYIDLKLNLKTDLGSSASKIPLVGHILMDKDSVSTSLKVTGKLSDPEVKTQIAKDIAVAPLNILLRTITLPIYLINSLDSNSSDAKK